MEIALQPAFAQGNGQFVVGLGEMIHADKHIAALGERVHGVLQNIELLFAAGHGFGVDAPLRFENVRQVGVVVEREAVGIEREHGVDGGFDAFERLVRQAVNQIYAHRFKTGFACRFNHFAGFFHGLDAVDGGLHFGVEILYAHAHAVEAEAA